MDIQIQLYLTAAVVRECAEEVFTLTQHVLFQPAPNCRG